MVLLKLLGIGLILAGYWLIRHFPGLLEHQREGFTKTGIFIGLLSALIGIILLLVG